MYGANDLKASITVTETSVECPVKGCPEKVERQRKVFKCDPQFQCPKHQIYISPSTFEYPSKLDNLLWKDKEDQALLQAIRSVKRESRMARDNSEDAVSWNVFRYLEKTNQLSDAMSSFIGSPITNSEVIYWSYSQNVCGIWPKLIEACKEFGEHLARRSEPDLIVISDSALFWIEAKLTATNKTKPSKPEATKKYLTGGNGWFQQVFTSDYYTVAVHQQKYELMRFWLLGSWIADQMDVDYYLVSLVPEVKESDIVELFDPLIKTNIRRKFMRMTWEDIYRFISERSSPTEGRRIVLDYFTNKTIGYDHVSELELAFSLKTE